MHRVGYLITEGFQIMSLATQTVFELANIVAGSAVYRIENFSIEGGMVRSSLGTRYPWPPRAWRTPGWSLAR